MCEDGITRNASILGHSETPSVTLSNTQSGKAESNSDVFGKNETIEQQLESVLNRYAGRLISTSEVIKRLEAILHSATELDDVQRQDMKERYFEKIEEAMVHRARAITKREGDEAPRAQQPLPTNSSRLNGIKRENVDRAVGVTYKDGEAAVRSTGIRRGRELYDDAYGNYPLKRIRNVNKDHDARYAWNWGFPGGGPPWDNDELVTNAEKTRMLRNVYLVDVQGALRSLEARRGRPVFPEVLWRNILLNQHVDFAQIVEDYHAITPTYPETIILGDEVELTINRAPLLKRKQLRTIGEWMLAWEIYQPAVCHAYPHRARELQKYRAHVLNKFESVRVEARVISYDSAVRKCVHERDCLDLGDSDTHQTLYHHLAAGGGGGGISQGEAAGPSNSRSRGSRNTGSGGGGDKAKKRTWICRKFNGREGCSYPSCRYLHRCQRCNAEHPRWECLNDGQ